ncbi:MAG: PrsW family intramembrane metalloprotease [Anaerolineae bacterium]|nr:PrsW family intramembrane metalloprotease [Anaerolineae bacterium]
MQTKQTHWASLLTLIVIATSLFFLLLLSAMLGLTSLVDLFAETGEGVDPASGMISAVAFGFLGVMLLICGWLVLQKTRGLESADLPFNFPFVSWLWVVIPAVVFISILVGGLVTLAELPWLNWIVLPFLTVLVIASPIWLVFGAASRGIELGPRWRFFSIFGLSLTVAPVLMVVFELVMVVLIILVGAVYVSFAQPELVRELEAMMLSFNENMSQEALLAMLAPYLRNPVLIATGIGYIAIIVPLIEEMLKPLAVWLFARKIESPAQGFALGVLSGAAFALFESLNASADGSMTWAVIVTARTGTSLLHMMTSGLVGWGIASAFGERRIGRFFAAYALAVLIHGIWNAAAAGTGIAAIGEMIGRPEWVFTVAPALVCGLITLAIGICAVLIASNRKLRAQPAEVKVESPA